MAGADERASQLANQSNGSDLSNRVTSASASSAELGKLVKEELKGSSDIKDQIKILNEIVKTLRQNHKEELDKLKEKFGEDSQEYKDAKKRSDQQYRDNLSETRKIHVGLKQLANTVEGVGKAMTQYFDKVITNEDQYRNTINTRLQGITTMGNTQNKYQEMQSKITKSFGTSMLVREDKILQSMNKAVEAGVARNIEQRAMLDTLSENIAGTFQEFSQELNRLIRIQQEDTSTLMLGMESSLTTLLNGWYQDSSYLTDVKTTSITNSLMEAMAGMNAVQASEFNFTIQKWLGALYSLGMSGGAISNIASGLGQLYSGNVSSLSDDMQNLFAMSAARSGQSYAEILQGNRSQSQYVNSLLESMVEYLAEIAESPNNVVETAYGKVFGMSISDLQAATNLATSNLADVSNQVTDTATMIGQVSTMIDTIDERLGIGGMMSNLASNFGYTTAANLLNNGVGSTIYRILQQFKGLGLTDLSIVNPSVLGNSIGFNNISIGDIINAGLGAASILSGAFTILDGINSGNFGTNLSSEWWNTTNIKTSGTGFTGLDTNVATVGRSLTGGAGSDVSTSELNDYKSQSLKQQGYGEDATAAPEHDIDNIYDQLESLLTELSSIESKLFDGSNRKPILCEISNINNLLKVDENGNIKTIVNNTIDNPVYVNMEMSGMSNTLSNSISAVRAGDYLNG